MKNDIETNIESIINEVDETTFQQCVNNYQERLDTLGKFGKEKIANTAALKNTLG